VSGEQIKVISTVVQLALIITATFLISRGFTMLLQILFAELVGKQYTEFEPITVILPVCTRRRVDLLAKQIGVPSSRLCAELLSACIEQAEMEWGMVDGAMKPAAAEKPAQNHCIPDSMRLVG